MYDLASVESIFENSVQGEIVAFTCTSGNSVEDD